MPEKERLPSAQQYLCRCLLYANNDKALQVCTVLQNQNAFFSKSRLYIKEKRCSLGALKYFVQGTSTLS